MFRKGKALGELGFFDKSVKVLEELMSKSPAGRLYLTCRIYPTCLMSILDAQMASAEIARLRVIDQAKEKANNQKLKGDSFSPCKMTAHCSISVRL